MIDTRQIIRAMLLGLAPKDHRKLSAEELVRIGYSETVAKQMVQAWAEQTYKNNDTSDTAETGL